MATLQKSVLQDDTTVVDNIDLEVVFSIPQFGYFTNLEDSTLSSNKSGKVTVFRERKGSINVHKEIASGTKEYFVNIPVIGSIIEENDNKNLYYQYQQQLTEGKGIDTEDLSFKIIATIYNKTTNVELGVQEFETFDLLKYNRSALNLSNELNTAIFRTKTPFLSVDDFVFLLNKDAFSKLVDDLNIGHHSHSVLQIIASGFM